MNSNFVDYFKILQVHFTASDEVIKAAYRALSKKYHPDNEADNTQFLLLKEAYETLINQESKEAYLKVFAETNGPRNILKGNQLPVNDTYVISIAPLRQLIVEYLYFIKNKQFEDAFNMLAQHNKDKIFKKDFVMWQSLVSEIHQLIEFDCAFVGVEEVELDQGETASAVCFKVKIVEDNKLLDHKEEDFFIRRVICEDGNWRLLLGPINIKDIIKKYRKIVSVHKNNEKIIEKYYKKYEHDYRSGFVNKTTFLNNSEYELVRYSRYGHPYSLAKITFNGLDEDGFNMYKEYFINHFRELDSICALNENSFLVLLPETDEIGAALVKGKFKKYLLEKTSDFEIHTKTVDEYVTSTKELIKELGQD